MKAFTTLDGLVAPLDRANVDTDAIIPKQFLKSIQRSGFGPYLFDEWRYQDHGEPGMDCTGRPLQADFVLNQARYQDTSILLARENFGCGSSREHAVWALDEYGIRCVIAPSFADIFFSNCFKSGLLPIRLDVVLVEQLFALAGQHLPAQGVLAVYGPFNYRGQFTSDSNASFDRRLQEMAPHQGIRDFEKVDALAQRAGLSLLEDHAMPSNNRCLVWQVARGVALG